MWYLVCNWPKYVGQYHQNMRCEIFTTSVMLIQTRVANMIFKIIFLIIYRLQLFNFGIYLLFFVVLLTLKILKFIRFNNVYHILYHVYTQHFNFRMCTHRWRHELFPICPWYMIPTCDLFLFFSSTPKFVWTEN